MAFNRRTGSSNTAASNIQRRSGSTWAQVQKIDRRMSGAWVRVWNSYRAITASTDYSMVYGSGEGGGQVSTTMVNVWVAGGTGQYTYTWRRISGVASMNVSNAAVGSVYFYANFTSRQDVTYTADFECVITDGISSASVIVTAQISHSPLGGGGGGVILA